MNSLCQDLMCSMHFVLRIVLPYAKCNATIPAAWLSAHPLSHILKNRFRNPIIHCSIPLERKKMNRFQSRVRSVLWLIFFYGDVIAIAAADTVIVFVVVEYPFWLCRDSDFSLFIYSLSQPFIDAVHQFYYSVDGLIVDADADIVGSRMILFVYFELEDYCIAHFQSVSLSLPCSICECYWNAVFCINQKVIAITS